MDPKTAVCIIEVAMRDELSVIEIAVKIHADHKTDDNDENAPYNRKTGLLSKIHDRTHRYQEILLGEIQFIDVTSHHLKSIQSKDFAQNHPSFVALRKSREEATLKHVRSLNVDELIDFTAPLYDGETGGWNFDLQAFLKKALDYWKKLVEKETQ